MTGKRRWKKILSCLMAGAMMCTMLPMNATYAAEAEVYDAVEESETEVTDTEEIPETQAEASEEALQQTQVPSQPEAVVEEEGSVQDHEETEEPVIIQDGEESVGASINYGTWRVVVNDDDTLTVTGCSNSEYMDTGVLEIPDTIQGKTVTGVSGEVSIGNDGNEYLYFNIFTPSVLKTIKFPDTIQQIHNSDAYKNEDVFGNCFALESIYLPDNSSYYMGDRYSSAHTFSHCDKIKSVFLNGEALLDEDVSEYFAEAFPYVEELTFYEGNTNIVKARRGAENKNLKTINLPSTTEIFSWSNEGQLTTLNCAKDLNKISTEYLSYCPQLHIPVYVYEWGNSNYIGQSDFENSGITSITIDASLLTQGMHKDTFSTCPDLTAINVAGGNPKVTGCYSIDGVLFWHYASAEEEIDDLFVYPAGKSTTGDYVVPSFVRYIYIHAFDNCKFTSITFPENMETCLWDSGWDSNGEWSRIGAFISAKIRMVRASAACCFGDYEMTEADIASWIDAKPGQVEFYKGSTYQISYNLNGGVNAPGNPTSYRAGDDYIVLSNPTKSGYKFLGWTRNGDTDYYENTTKSYGYFQNYTFTANWQKNVPVTKIKLSGISTKIAAGKKLTLGLVVSPADATSSTVTWTSSNTKYATVSSSGVVTMKKAGAGKTVIITATAKDGSGVKTSYKIKIMKGVVKKVTLKGSKTLKAGKKLKLKTTVKATKGANKKVTYTSSNKKYATVNSKGQVKALKAGKGKTVTITAKATDGSGKKAKIKIKIK